MTLPPIGHYRTTPQCADSREELGGTRDRAQLEAILMAQCFHFEIFKDFLN